MPLALDKKYLAFKTSKPILTDRLGKFQSSNRKQGVALSGANLSKSKSKGGNHEKNARKKIGV
jgi:hypothetical protein